jgi:uncharacterized protein
MAAHDLQRVQIQRDDLLFDHGPRALELERRVRVDVDRPAVVARLDPVLLEILREPVGIGEPEAAEQPARPLLAELDSQPPVVARHGRQTTLRVRMTNGDWKHPSPRLRRVRHVEAFAVAAVIGLVVGALLAISSLTAAAIAIGAAFLGGVVLDVLLQRRVGAWGYLEREDDLLVRRGLLVRRLSVVPYGRMQFIDVVAGPVERAFGLATVRLHTAAAATDARIPGLASDEAARLRDRLAELGEAGAAGL